MRFNSADAEPVSQVYAFTIGIIGMDVRGGLYLLFDGLVGRREQRSA